MDFNLNREKQRSDIQDKSTMIIWQRFNFKKTGNSSLPLFKRHTLIERKQVSVTS